MKVQKKGKIKCFIPSSEELYRRPIKYTEDEKVMMGIYAKLKPIKVKYLYKDLSDDLNNKKRISFKLKLKSPEKYNQTSAYQSTYFNTKGKQMYDYSNIKSKIFEHKNYGFEYIMKNLNLKMNFYNVLYKKQEKKISNFIKIGDKNQAINSNTINFNTLSNRDVSKKEYRKTMNKLFLRIQKIKE